MKPRIVIKRSHFGGYLWIGQAERHPLGLFLGPVAYVSLAEAISDYTDMLVKLYFEPYFEMTANLAVYD